MLKNENFKEIGYSFLRKRDKILYLLIKLRHLVMKGAGVPISDYLDDRLVVFLNVESQDEAFRQMIDNLEEAHKLKDPDVFYKAILNRENLMSTGIGLGVAIPHAKLAGYEDFFISIGIQSGKGIEWNSLDGTPVQLIFMIGGPDDKQTDYLNILSRLTTAIKDSQRRLSLLNATSAKQVIELFKEC